MRAILLLVLISAAMAGPPKGEVVFGKDNDPRQSFNVVIACDGWLEKDRARYLDTANRLIGKLTSTAPLDGYKRLFRFTVLETWSDQWGVSVKMPPRCEELFKMLEDAGAPVRRSTDKVESYFGLELSLRDVTCAETDKPVKRMKPEEREALRTCCNKAAGVLSIGEKGYDRIQKEIMTEMVPDCVVILTPDDDFQAAWTAPPHRQKDAPPGMSCTVIMMTMWQLNNNFEAIADTFVHEMGHAIFKLEDEYSSESGSCVEPSIDYGDPANITLNPKRPKWQHLIDWGMVQKDPVVGGLMNCTTGVWHPTPNCRMNRSAGAFCPVCLERIAHGAGERASSIKESSPGGRRVDAKSNDTLKFWVTTMPMEDRSAEYAYNWSLDGRSIEAGTIRLPQKSYFEVTVGPLATGLHTLSFEVQDRRRASTEPGAPLTAKLPVSTRYWTIHVRSHCAFWKFGCEKAASLEEEFFK